MSVSVSLGNSCVCQTYPFAIAVVESLQFDDVGVSDDAHDLQFTILPSVSTWLDAYMTGMILP